MFFNILNMSTYREVVYMCLDELKFISDDAYFTQDHIIFLADKYRAFLLKKNYTDLKKTIPESDYQTICLDLEKVQGIEGDNCSGMYLRSTTEIPDTLPIGNPQVTPMDFMGGEITYVSRERIKYVGCNKFLKGFIYCTIGPDHRLYLKSSNNQMYYLEKVKFTGIFEDSAEASKLSCDDSENSGNCDPLDNTYPLEEALIPLMIELVVKELSGAAYRPEDEENNAKDDISSIMLNSRRNYGRRGVQNYY